MRRFAQTNSCDKNVKIGNYGTVPHKERRRNNFSSRPSRAVFFSTGVVIHPMPVQNEGDFMRFLIRKRRSAPAVIIVALVDVLIVLVIFLLVTTTFKQQAALKLQLPESSQAKKTGANENPPFVVDVTSNGTFYLEDEKLYVTITQLRGELLDRVNRNPNLILAIRADEKAPWGKIVELRDAAAEAKIKTLVAYTKQENKP